MSYIQMRTFPGLFIGRRSVVVAQLCDEGEAGGYRCGACERLIHRTCDPAELRDVVVRCSCGEVNQL